MSSVRCCEICGDKIYYKNKNYFYNNKIKIDDFMHRIHINVQRETLFKGIMSRIFRDHGNTDITIYLCSKCKLSLLDNMISKENKI